LFERLLRTMTVLMAQAHDLIMRANEVFGLALSDKQMHFAIMLGIGMALFFAVHYVFKRLAKWSITAVSFIYVFTVMAGLGFAIEIGQRVSGTGEMDFGDIVAGLYGVLAFFAAYSVYRMIAYVLGRIFGKK